MWLRMLSLRAIVASSQHFQFVLNLIVLVKRSIVQGVVKHLPLTFPLRNRILSSFFLETLPNCIWHVGLVVLARNAEVCLC